MHCWTARDIIWRCGFLAQLSGLFVTTRLEARCFAHRSRLDRRRSQPLALPLVALLTDCAAGCQGTRRWCCSSRQRRSLALAPLPAALLRPLRGHWRLRLSDLLLALGLPLAARLAWRRSTWRLRHCAVEPLLPAGCPTLRCRWHHQRRRECDCRRLLPRRAGLVVRPEVGQRVDAGAAAIGVLIRIQHRGRRSLCSQRLLERLGMAAQVADALWRPALAPFETNKANCQSQAMMTEPASTAARLSQGRRQAKWHAASEAAHQFHTARRM